MDTPWLSPVDLGPEPAYDDWGLPAQTVEGVRCANHGDWRVYHFDAAAVRACFTVTAQMQADQDAEIAAEQAYVRHLEDRGYWEARAQDDYEARMGVIDFADAYRMACPWLFTDEDELAGVA